MLDYVALVIAYHRPDLIRNVLQLLDLQTVPPRSVVIVDNGGDLGNEATQGFGLSNRTTVVRRDNPGYAAAVNIALAEANDLDADALLVLTHDAEFPPDLAQLMLATLEADPTAGIVGPTIHWASRPERIFSAGGRLTARGRAYHEVEVSESAREVDWVDGAIVLYRAQALTSVGGMDERYFLYFEDVDTSWALRRVGFTTIVIPLSGAQEPGAHPPYLGIRNMVLFAEKAGITRLQSGLAVVRRILEDCTYAILHGKIPPLRALMRGWRDGLRGLSGKPDA